MKITDTLLYLIKENTRAGAFRWTNLGPEMYTAKFEGYDLIVTGNSKYDEMSVVITILGDNVGKDTKHKGQTEIIRSKDHMYFSAIDLLRTVEDLYART